MVVNFPLVFFLSLHIFHFSFQMLMSTTSPLICSIKHYQGSYFDFLYSCSSAVCLQAKNPPLLLLFYFWLATCIYLSSVTLFSRLCESIMFSRLAVAIKCSLEILGFLRLNISHILECCFSALKECEAVFCATLLCF